MFQFNEKFIRRERIIAIVKSTARNHFLGRDWNLLSTGKEVSSFLYSSPSLLFKPWRYTVLSFSVHIISYWTLVGVVEAWWWWIAFGEWLTEEQRLQLISSRDHCQKFSPPQISNRPRAVFEPAQNLNSNFLEWITPQCH